MKIVKIDRKLVLEFCFVFIGILILGYQYSILKEKDPKEQKNQLPVLKDYSSEMRMAIIEGEVYTNLLSRTVINTSSVPGISYVTGFNHKYKVVYIKVSDKMYMADIIKYLTGKTSELKNIVEISVDQTQPDEIIVKYSLPEEK